MQYKLNIMLYLTEFRYKITNTYLYVLQSCQKVPRIVYLLAKFHNFFCKQKSLEWLRPLKYANSIST